MKTNEMIKIAGGKLVKLGLRLRKSSPEILAVTGVIGVVTAAVMACKATTKLNEVLGEAKDTVDTIHKTAENEDMKEKYTPEDVKKDLTIVYAHTGWKLAKLYGPAVALGALSLTGLLASNHILRKRYLGISAAYATLDRSFREYRKAVVDRFGQRVDHELRHGIKAVEITEETKDENGKTKKEKKTLDVVDPNAYSGYAKIFDESNVNFEKDSEYNLMFLRQQQQYANDLLKANGILFLNDVYKMLGFEPTKAGQVVGWVYDPDHPVGDNFVDFGIYDVSREKARDFVNGYERAIVLDFNVDGDVWSLMK